MSKEKKFFVDINLQSQKLVNAVIGTNSDMTKQGAIRYNGSDLEYYDGTAVRALATAADLAALNAEIGIDLAELSEQVSSMLSNIDPVALDSFTELLAAFQSADSSLATTISNLSTSATSAINAETARATAAEGVLTTNLASEIANRTSAVSTEETDRENADTTLQSNITT